MGAGRRRGDMRTKRGMRGVGGDRVRWGMLEEVGGMLEVAGEGGER